VSTHRQYASLQAGRGLAALLVVVHHVCFFATGTPHLWQRPAIARWTAGPQLGVAFFFVLSGIVILTAHWKDIGNPASVPSYLWKRFRRIYPVYLLVLAPVLCSQLTSSNPEFVYKHDPFVILSNILLVHIHSSQTNLAVAWTLFHEVMFYAVFALILLHKRMGATLIAVWLLLSLVNLAPGGSVLPQNFFSPLHLLFAMGLVAAWLLRQQNIRQPTLLLTAGAFVLLACIVYAGWAGQASKITYVSAGLGSTLALLGAAELETQGRLRTPRWLAFLGDASYSIYLIHFPVVSTVGRIAFRLDPQPRLPLGVWMLLMFATGTIAGCLLHMFVERPLLKWLGGSRRPAERSILPGLPAK